MKLLESYFTDKEKSRITDIIKAAENKTSGEIRVYFERNTDGQTPQERAIQAFYKLGMDKTELKNGVLFYIAFDDQKYAVIGDKGIHEKVHDEFWEKISVDMKKHFAKAEFIEGLEAGIYEVGERLQHYFPVQDDDINELPNEIILKETDEEE